MRGAGHGVFWDSGARGKKAGDEIGVVSRRGGDDSEAIELSEKGHVGRERGDFGLGIVDGEVVAGFEKFAWFATERAEQFVRRGTSDWGARWKIELDEIGAFRGGQPSAPGVEANGRMRMA